jgi:hypothetical protein
MRMFALTASRVTKGLFSATPNTWIKMGDYFAENRKPSTYLHKMEKCGRGSRTRVQMLFPDIRERHPCIHLWEMELIPLARRVQVASIQLLFGIAGKGNVVAV